MNYGLVLVNVLLFILGHNASSPANQARISQWMLEPDLPTLEQFFSCMFLHASFWHLLGNMIFLWVFGNAVNDKFGHAGYLAFYLAGGVLAGVGYLLMGGNAPVLGASGAIAAVAGAYLVLLPATNITLIVWLFYLIIPVEVSSLYFIAFQFVFEIFMTLRGLAGPASGGVAYTAHATGYVYGILIAAALLAARLLPRDDYDLLHLLKARHRRSQYRRMAAGGYDPFHPTAGVRMRRTVKTKTVQPTAPPGAETEEMQLRQKINRAFGAHDVPTATELYLELNRLAEEPVLPQQQQLDVTNQLMSSKQYAAAAQGYERFIQHFGNYKYLVDIHLMLGLLYGRYLHQYNLAETYLAGAIEKLTDPNKRKMAQEDLAAVQRRKKSH